MPATNFYEALANDILKWSVNDTQLNPDRGATKDAFQVGLALQGLDYEAQSGMLDQTSNNAIREMGAQADYARRNALDLMTAEGQVQGTLLDKSIKGSLDVGAQEGKNARELQAETNKGVFAQADASRSVGLAQAAASTTVGLAGAEANKYAANADKDARLGTAMYQSEAAKYGADASRDVGFASAAYGYRGQVESAREQGQAARDVAETQGRYGLDAARYSQDAETTRAREGYASSERQIGLTGTETRKTVETQGEQSRKNIATEGDQARQNIRTTGDEQRRSLAYDRANAAKLAMTMSRRA